MANLTDIREGLAANMHALLAAGTVKQVSPWLEPSPNTPALQVAGVRNIDYDQTFGRGRDTIYVVVEAAIGTASDVGSQKILDRLLAASGSTSVKTAIETDRQLTSRYNAKDGVTTGQSSACDDLRVEQYMGQQVLSLKNGTEALVATWLVRLEVTP